MRHKLRAIVNVLCGRPTIYRVDFVPGPKWVNFRPDSEVLRIQCSFTGFWAEGLPMPIFQNTFRTCHLNRWVEQ